MNAFVHEPRDRLSDRERARLFLERGGQCHRCKRKLRPGDDWIDEHLIALENGGTNDWDNRGITCAWCKPTKDGEDHKKAAHAKRVSVNHVVPGKRREKRRGFRRPAGVKFDWSRGSYRKDE
jgi:5-methylcytosine-specific restriction endonuclease McrA